MRKPFIIRTVVASALLLGLAGCDVEVEEEGQLPEVGVDAESGQMPEYEVRQTEEGRLPDVDVNATGGNWPEVDVDTPQLDVTRDTIEVPVPDVDIETPAEERPGQ